MTSERVPVVASLLLLLAAGPAVPETPPEAVGLDLAGVDREVAPGDDFYAYANGNWARSTEIPADRGGVGAFTTVFDATLDHTAEIVRGAVDAPAGSEARKVGDFYTAWMDEEGIEKKGLDPVRKDLARIAALGDRKALARYLGETVQADVDGINATNLYTPNVLGLWVAQDMDEPTRYVPFLLQGGLDMPDRAYYLDPSPRMAELRGRLHEHIATLLSLAGLPEAKARAERVFELERRLAEAHATREASGDVKTCNNHWSREDLSHKAPGLDWNEFLTGAGLAGQSRFVLWQPGAVVGLAALATEVPLDTWKDYLTFHAVEAQAAVLPRAVADEAFAFHGTAVFGVPAQRDRWKRAVGATSQALGDVVGRLYVERFFPPAHKARMQEMVANLMTAFGRRIDRLDWMSPATRERAKAKLGVLRVGVGYPDRWEDYSSLQVTPDDAWGNARRAARLVTERALRKLGQPVDRGEWVMTPQTVNAVNLPVMNAMNFPAAFLQPPFFDPDRTLAMDYGAIGAVIGHEVSHSFDDQGAEFDDTGRLRNWWTPEDRAHFEKASARLVAQYDAYRPFPDLAVNGRQTLGENLADVAGLAAAYDAYHMALGDREAPVVAGLTGDQQFFLSYAQAWRSKMREGVERARIIGDGHSPGRYRAATVRNLDAWYEAFRVVEGQGLYLAPADRVRIW